MISLKANSLKNSILLFRNTKVKERIALNISYDYNQNRSRLDFLFQKSDTDVWSEGLLIVTLNSTIIFNYMAGSQSQRHQLDRVLRLLRRKRHLLRRKSFQRHKQLTTGEWISKFFQRKRSANSVSQKLLPKYGRH